MVWLNMKIGYDYRDLNKDYLFELQKQLKEKFKTTPSNEDLEKFICGVSAKKYFAENKEFINAALPAEEDVIRKHVMYIIALRKVCPGCNHRFVSRNDNNDDSVEICGDCMEKYVKNWECPICKTILNEYWGECSDCKLFHLPIPFYI